MRKFDSSATSLAFFFFFFLSRLTRSGDTGENNRDTRRRINGESRLEDYAQTICRLRS